MTIDRSDVRFYVKVQRQGTSAAERLDATIRVMTMSYEDTEAAADKLKLTINNGDLANFDNPLFADGNILEVSWGYPGVMTPPRECVITKVTGSQVLAVEALGRENLLHRLMKTQVFEMMKRSDVVAQIATEAGYGPEVQDIEDTQVVLSQISQSRMTDYAFIRQLAQKEGFQVYIDARGFHFHRRRLGQKPRKVLNYFTDKAGTIVSFTIESDITAKPGAVTAVGRDLLKKENINERADDPSTKGRPSLAPILKVVDAKTGATTFQKNNASEATMATTATNAADAKRQAAGAFQNAQHAAVLMTWLCVGDPEIEAKSVLIGNGFGARLSGGYYVTHATHNIKPGYMLTLKVRRDGTSTGGTGVASSGTNNDQKAPATSDGLEPKKIVDPRTGATTVQFVRPGQQSGGT